MSNDLVTVAIFDSPVEANLAKNRLSEAGVVAYLADEETVGMVWTLAKAVGAIKLQVAGQDADNARAILLETHESSVLEMEEPGTFKDPETETEDDEEEVISEREQNADRAYRAAVFGLLCLPFQLYAFWLVVKVFDSNNRLAGLHRRRAWVAAAINLPLMAGLCLLLRFMLVYLKSE